jgi:hypothetical protein
MMRNQESQRHSQNHPHPPITLHVPIIVNAVSTTVLLALGGLFFILSHSTPTMYHMLQVPRGT